MKIKDSGHRRKFHSGAVRDIQEGKGRCDLTPLHELSDVYWELKSYLPSIIIKQLAYTQDYLKDGQYQTAQKKLNWALIVFAELRGWKIPEMFLEVSKHYEQGAKKYGEYNWQKGIPFNSYIDSAVRHLLKYLAHMEDEPHDRAFVWNVLSLKWTIRNRKELPKC